MKAICTLPAGGSVTVRSGETGRTFRRGDEVDLDASTPSGESWRQALGKHVSAFTEAGDPRELWNEE